MTLRRLRWLLLPLAAAGALAIVVLPPRTPPERFSLVGYFLGMWGGPWTQDVRRQHHQAVERARAYLLDVIGARAHGAADVLASHSARAIRSAGEPLIVVRDPEVPAAAAAIWLQTAERELAPIPRTPAAPVPVIVALHVRSHRPTQTGGELPKIVVAERFQLEDGASRACIVDITLPRQGEAGRSRFEVPRWLKAKLLDRCAFYARFGFPGAGVGRWAGLAARWTEGWQWWYGYENLFAPRHASPDTVRFRPQYGSVPWAELACFRGMADYCAALAGLGRRAKIGRADGFYFYYGWEGLPSTDRLVAGLILDRGPERFARFWTSPFSPDSALHMAYGVPAGVLVREAYSYRFVAQPTAQPGVAMLLVSAGWALALGALSMALSWRREMDL